MTTEMRTRDSMGRFIKGVSGNPRGRLPRQTEERYLEVTFDKVSPEQWGEVVEKVFELAKKGDMRAVEWLGRHFMGDPVQVHQYLSASRQEIIISVRFGDEPEEEVLDVEYETE